MKKAFCFSLIAIIIALASAPALVKADDVAVITPYVDTPTLSDSDREKYAQALFLTDYLRNGGTVDLSNTSSGYSSTDLLSDFGDFVNDVIDETFNILDIINPFQSEFEWGKGYPLKPATSPLIEFMGKLPFYALNQNEEPTPEPPVDYANFIDIINGSGFYKPNRDTFEYRDFSGLKTWEFFTPFNSYSYYVRDYSYPNTSNYLQYTRMDLTSIYIFSSNDTYTFTNNCTLYNKIVHAQDDSNWYKNAYIYSDGNFGSFSDTISNNSIIFTQTGTIEEVLIYICNNFRNVNIYVDGVPWSIVGSTISYNIQLTTGSVTPQGERIRWMYDKEIYVDIERVIERLDNLIEEIKNTPNTPTIIKFDDLDDLIVDVNGTPALAVKVINNELSLDDRYSEDFGPIIPLFVPMFTPVINDSDIVTVTDVATSPLPDELMEVCGYIFVGTLFACFIHRLLE